MTEESPVSIDEVRELVTERHRFDEWLQALESRREATPDHVYERVHADYLERRRDVMRALHAHVPELGSLLAELNTRLETVRDRCQAEEDERDEANLRHVVGEYDDGKWNEVKQRVESTLATLGGERTALEEQRDDVQSLLESARPEPVEDAVKPDAQDAEEQGPAAAESEVGVSASEELQIVNEATAAGREAESEALRPDQLFSDSQTREADAHTTRAQRDESSGEQSRRASDSEGEDFSTARDQGNSENASSDRGGSEAGAADRDRGSEGRPQEERDRWSAAGAVGRQRDRSTTVDPDDLFGDAKPSAADSGKRAQDSGQHAAQEGRGGAGKDRTESRPVNPEFDELAFLRSVTDSPASGSGSSPNLPKQPSGSQETQKTLRCTECGTMNLPTEWYCERCGGELAAF